MEMWIQGEIKPITRTPQQQQPDQRGTALADQDGGS